MYITGRRRCEVAQGWGIMTRISVASSRGFFSFLFNARCSSLFSLGFFILP